MSFDTTSTETTPELSVDTTAIEVTTPQEIEAPLEPEFTPNYKYKAYGKEFEVDEWARPLINKDNQEHMIKLYEKSGGFDHLKTNFKDLETRYGQTEQTNGQFMQIRNAILSNIDKGDLGKAFNIIGLSDDQVMNYVRQKLEYAQLAPDQRAVVDQYRATMEGKAQAESALEQQQRYAEELMMEKHEWEVQKTFADPKYASTINEYNTRLGDENAFRSVVKQIGSNEFFANGRNLPVGEAVDRAIRMLALNPAQAQQISQSSDTTPVSHQTPSKPAPRPIMRVGKGGGSTPVKQRPRSLDDLKNIYQQEYGA
jgi:hypothetical protein